MRRDGSVWRSRPWPCSHRRAAAWAMAGRAPRGRPAAPARPGSHHPTGADELVLRVAYEGGFVAPEYTLASTPFWSLFGDGTLIVPGPQIEIYPGPALPNLLATPITQDGVQAILRAARDAGLMDGDATYGNDCIADAATTVFTTNAAGQTSVVSAYALDVGEPAGSCGGMADADERSALAEFQAKLGDLGSWLPEGSIGTEHPYPPTEMRVYVLPYQPRPRTAARLDRVAARRPARGVRRARLERPDGRPLRGGHRFRVRGALRRGGGCERAHAVDERRHRVPPHLAAVAPRRTHLLALGCDCEPARLP